MLTSIHDNINAESYRAVLTLQEKMIALNWLSYEDFDPYASRL
jgi:hypothetical protein